MAARDLTGEFTLDDATYAWSVRPYAGETSADENFRGLVARVTLAGAGCRELMITFDPAEYPARRTAATADLIARITAATGEALAAGWRPDSRGKPFRFSPTSRAS